jgi:hypothetical protein
MVSWFHHFLKFDAVFFHKTITKGPEAKQTLLEYALSKRDMPPEHACDRDLLNADWVKGEKDGLFKDCDMDKILTMKRENLFMQLFTFLKPYWFSQGIYVIELYANNKSNFLKALLRIMLWCESRRNCNKNDSI